MVIKKEEEIKSNPIGCPKNKVVVPMNSMWKKAIINLVNDGVIDVEQVNKMFENLK